MASGKFNPIDSPEAFAAAFQVSRETLERLMAYEAMLTRWQKTINLVASSTINHIWHRHFADSAQLWFAAPPPPLWLRPGGGESQLSPPGIPPTPNPSPQGGGGSNHWLDIGSGAGFPGLVLAILGAEHGQTRHTLIESDNRKAAFLRETARELRVAVDILCTRIENPANIAKVGEVNCVTARALAPLPRLLELAAPYFGPGTIGLFSKGREVTAEIEESTRSWTFEAELKPSVTDPEASVLLLKALKVKTEG